MPDAADGHDAGAGRREQAVEQQAGQREVAEMIGAELQLEPVLGGRLRRVHHPCVVDQQVDLVVLARSASAAARTDSRDPRSSSWTLLGAGVADDQFGRGLALLEVAYGEHDVGALPGERAGGLIAEPGVGAGDDGGAAGLIRNVGGGPLRHGDLLDSRLSGAYSPLGYDYTERSPRLIYSRGGVRWLHPNGLRADAARNRARVLKVAYETFAAEGLGVPIDEIARRAGVGAGTVYRHFPTKEDLYRAVVDDRLRASSTRAVLC